MLNDILRYIDEENEDEPAEPAIEETADEPDPLDEIDAPVEPEVAKTPELVKDEPAQLDPVVVDQKLEEVSSSKENLALNGDADSTTEESQTLDLQSEPSTADPEIAVQQLAEEDAKEPEKPQDPSPTPVSKPTAPAPPAIVEPAAPAAPAAPPKPMTWASRAAAAAGPKPVIPLPKTPTPPVSAQSRAPAPAAPTSQPAAQAPAPAAAAAGAAAAPAGEAPAKEASGWQTAGADSKRQNRPQSISGPPAEKEGTLGYVKYVTEKVQEADLRGALAAHGELTYFDINRQKVCSMSQLLNLTILI